MALNANLFRIMDPGEGEEALFGGQVVVADGTQLAVRAREILKAVDSNHCSQLRLLGPFCGSESRQFGRSQFFFFLSGSLEDMNVFRRY